MPTPRPTIVVMFSTKTDIVWNCAATATIPSAIVIARMPTIMGSVAATSAPNASTSTASVNGSARSSPCRVSSALIVRTS